MPGSLNRNSSILRLTSIILVLVLSANFVSESNRISSYTFPSAFVVGRSNSAAVLENADDKDAPSATTRTEEKHDPVDSEKLHESYGRFPLNFEANKGQTDQQVKFTSRGSGYGLFLTPTEAVLVLNKGSVRKNKFESERPLTSINKQITSAAVVRMRLVGANEQPRVIGLDELPGKSNYFIGNDPKKWRTNIINYGKVKYEEVYRGVGMIYYGNQRELEYDFVVSPGADPSVIRIGFKGVRQLSTAGNGDLIMKMSEGGTMRQRQPVAYQVIDGRRTEIVCHYAVKGKRELAFELGAYDRSRELTIDPIIAYSTYLGGAGGDSGYDINVDDTGNAYVTGATWSTDFPTQNSIQDFGGDRDLFITKINAAGSNIVYSTYIGGSAGESAHSLELDASGSVYAVGATSSTDFPTLNAYDPTFGGGSDSFLLKLNAAGDALVYSTYLGGSDNDSASAVAVDNLGSAYVTGETRSTNFPTMNPYQANLSGNQTDDAFVTKFSPSGNTVVYSTFLGGGVYDQGYGIAVDSLGYAYVTGHTQSTDFPIVAALYPNISGDAAFVTKINQSGDQLVFSTFLGGASLGSLDIAFDIALDQAGNIYITGQTTGLFPTVNAYQPTPGGGTYDAFVTKMDGMGTSLLYSTYLGGSDKDKGLSIAVDSSGNAVVVGFTISPNFPKVRQLQSFLGGLDDFLIAKFDSSGTLVFSTYLGGSKHDDAEGIALDGAGNAYITGHTQSTNFPTVNPLQPPGSATNNADAIVLKISGLVSYSISGRVTDATNSGLNAVTVTLSGSQSGTRQTDANGYYTFDDVPASGNYTVTPTKAPYTFVPTSQTFNALSANQTADFTVAIHSISGTVVGTDNTPTVGATVTLSGTQSNTTQTDSDGNYSFPAVAKGGTYTVTPSKSDPVLIYTFSPTSQTISSLNADQTINFTSLTSIISALNPTADAYVRDGTSANTNFGTITPLRVETNSKSNNGKNYDGYFKFDLTGVGANITSAKFRIFAALSAAGSINTSVYSVANTSWLESGANSITWNNRPPRSATALPGATVSVNSTTYAAYDIDITAYAQSEKSAGRDVISVALHNPSASALFINVNSREASANKPQLVVSVGTDPNAPPSISLTSPGAGANFTSPAAIAVSANASDGDGSISKVEFYAGTSLIGTATSAPYQLTWSNVPAGTYSLAAVATDNRFASTVSDPVTVFVNLPNNPPSVSLTSPLEGTIMAAGVNLSLSANATDTDGTITKVEFFAGTTLIGTATVPTNGTYNITWTNVNSGAYALTAKATDNSNGATTSAVVNIKVVAPTGLSPTADAYVRDGSSATTNFGTATSLQTQSSATAGNNRETYLKFDLTTVTGIAKATLRLYGNLSDATGNNVPAAIYSVANTTWVESGNGSITWNGKPPAGTTALATTVISESTPHWYEFDVTAYLQTEKAAGRNVVSLVLKNTAQSNPFATFNSREATTNQPQLLLWSTQPRNALLVVGSTNLNTGDNAVKTRLQNIGFTVTVKAAGSNNNTAIKTSDADGKTLVLISSTVIPANVTNKFRNVAVPVLGWEFDILDDMGMTGLTSGTDFGTSSTSQTQLTIANSAHQMAAGLSGTQTVVTTGTIFTWGRPNANAAGIATLTSDATKFVIFGYDTQSAMSGLEAPARRVAMFLTDTTAAGLNANGGALFDAAVQWATALNTVPTINSLTPLFGPTGTNVTINGLNFGSSQGASTLTFNGVTASPITWSDKNIVAAVPAFATTGAVIITVNGVVSNGVIFVVGDIDSDGDGLPDWWEIQYFGNLNQTAAGDADGDGLTNLDEYQQGRNPTKSALADDGDFVNLRVYTPLTSPSP